MVDTVTVTLDLKFPQRVGGYGKVGIISGQANLTSYSQTKSALSAVTGLFKTLYRLVPDGQSSLGYDIRWDNAAQAFRALQPGAVTVGAAPAAVAITPPASAAAYTNADGVPETVIITGGTSTHAVIGRASGAFTSADVATTNPIVAHLDPGDTLTVTYSVAGTWTKLPFAGSTVAAADVEVANATNIGTINFIAIGQIGG